MNMEDVLLMTSSDEAEDEEETGRRETVTINNNSDVKGVKRKARGPVEEAEDEEALGGPSPKKGGRASSTKNNVDNHQSKHEGVVTPQLMEGQLEGIFTPLQSFGYVLCPDGGNQHHCSNLDQFSPRSSTRGTSTNPLKNPQPSYQIPIFSFHSSGPTPWTSLPLLRQTLSSSGAIPRKNNVFSWPNYMSHGATGNSSGTSNSVLNITTSSQLPQAFLFSPTFATTLGGASSPSLMKSGRGTATKTPSRVFRKRNYETGSCSPDSKNVMDENEEDDEQENDRCECEDCITYLLEDYDSSEEYDRPSRGQSGRNSDEDDYDDYIDDDDDGSNRFGKKSYTVARCSNCGKKFCRHTHHSCILRRQQHSDDEECRASRRDTRRRYDSGSCNALKRSQSFASFPLEDDDDGCDGYDHSPSYCSSPKHYKFRKCIACSGTITIPGNFSYKRKKSRSFSRSEKSESQASAKDRDGDESDNEEVLDSAGEDEEEEEEEEEKDGTNNKCLSRRSSRTCLVSDSNINFSNWGTSKPPRNHFVSLSNDNNVITLTSSSNKRGDNHMCQYISSSDIDPVSMCIPTLTSKAPLSYFNHGGDASSGSPFCRLGKPQQSAPSSAPTTPRSGGKDKFLSTNCPKTLVKADSEFPHQTEQGEAMSSKKHGKGEVCDAQNMTPSGGDELNEDTSNEDGSKADNNSDAAGAGESSIQSLGTVNEGETEVEQQDSLDEQILHALRVALGIPEDVELEEYEPVDEDDENENGDEEEEEAETEEDLSAAQPDTRGCLALVEDVILTYGKICSANEKIKASIQGDVCRVVIGGFLISASHITRDKGRAGYSLGFYLHDLETNSFVLQIQDGILRAAGKRDKVDVCLRIEIGAPVRIEDINVNHNKATNVVWVEVFF